MAGLKPIYLVCGDDDVKIDAWRTRIKRRAEQEGTSLEGHEAPAMTPAALAADLAALTFATGLRCILVDNIESWKGAALEPLERALADMPPETLLVLAARGKADPRLCKAVEGAGGQVSVFSAPQARDLGRWVLAHAAENGLKIDAEGARTLVALTGARQQRLAREVERLALLAYPATSLDGGQIAELASGETSQQAYDLADAVVAGDTAAALAAAERLRDQGETPSRLLYAVVRKLRDVHRAAELLDAGVRESDVPGKLKMPPWMAKRVIPAAKRAGRHALEDAICVFAQLEIEFRGGGLRAGYSLDEDTALSVAIARASGGMQRRAAA